MEEHLQEVLNGLKWTLKKLSEDKTVSVLTAKIMKNLYEALIDEGFSPEQAMHIVANHQLKL